MIHIHSGILLRHKKEHTSVSSIIQSEVSQKEKDKDRVRDKEKDKYCILTHIYGI